ncbi:MAG: hypothetical protein HY699_00970 [Deltaproteobacteria bacterium]|nr:hypothetical protein [Deltaproteobacteria bacterium]
MLFVAEYELNWPSLDAAIAKRLDWNEVQPEGFRFVGEYVWQNGEPPFRGVAIIEADSVEALNSFVVHYGPTLKMNVHPASDVVSAISLAGGSSRRSRPARSSSRRRK